MTAPRMGKGAVKKAELTEFIPVSTKPAINGFYDYRYTSGYLFNAEWNGTRFIVRDAAFPENDGILVYETVGHTWRGLASDPSKGAA